MAASTPSGRQRLTLLATSVGLCMIYLDATIVKAALPDIQGDFHSGEQGLQWVVAAYSLTMGMFIMSAATLADLRGRRRVFIAGTALFALASALCGLAPSLLVLTSAEASRGSSSSRRPDEAFVEGIRTALAVGAGLVLLVLIAGCVVFPKGTKEQAAEEGEAVTLAKCAHRPPPPWAWAWAWAWAWRWCRSGTWG